MEEPSARINGNKIGVGWAKTESHETWLNTTTIGGNSIKYYLLVLDKPLRRALKAELEGLGVEILQHNGNNIYLCLFKTETKLGDIRYREGIEGVIPLPEDFKIESNLKSSKGEIKEDDVRQVRIFLQGETDTSTKEVSEQISSKTNIPIKDMLIEKDGSAIQMEVKGGNLPQIASLDSVAAIREVVGLELDNYKARETLGVDWSSPNTTEFQGQGQIVTVADSGFDTGDLARVHPAFVKRIADLVAIGRDSKTNDRNGHGTHVCGSVVGTGQSNGENVSGTAPESRLIVQSIENENGELVRDMSDLLRRSYSNETSPSRVHTNSWGPKWIEFKNSTEQVVGQKPYDEGSTAIDQFIWDHPDMCVVRSAGNHGEQQLRDEATNRTWSGHIGSYAAAKNAITVGSCQNRERSSDERGLCFDPNGEFPWTPDSISPFSSRGPTNDHRIKPDVVAPGGMVLSAASRDPAALETFKRSGTNAFGPSDPPLWRYSSGTSMAAPQVAGCVAVLRQILVTTWQKPSPTAALIKALLIHGATSLGENVPRTQQGFGRVNLANSIRILDAGTIQNPTFIEDDIYDEDDREKYERVVRLSDYLPSDSRPGKDTSTFTLKATMVYTDWRGEALQHDLDLCVMVPGHGYRLGNATDADYGQHDRFNNVEQAVWSGLGPSTEATIQVTLENTILAKGEKPPRQPFALVWSVTEDKS